MRIGITRTAMLLLAVLGAAADLWAQNLSDARRLYDSGKYREAVGAISNPDAANAPRLVYLKAQSHEKLGESEEAGRVYGQLSGAGAEWKSVAESAMDLLRRQKKEALAAAARAVSQNGGLAEAQYQLGLAASFNDDFARAASAFDRAAEIDPQWAYARYYAGLAYYKAKRIDLVAARFEAFLKLAPNAPERPEVESIMRTLRGR